MRQPENTPPAEPAQQHGSGQGKKQRKSPYHIQLQGTVHPAPTRVPAGHKHLDFPDYQGIMTRTALYAIGFV